MGFAFRSAFRSLGPHLNAFLFSPIGAHVLRYVLSYHIVPDIIWHTDHCDKTNSFTSIVTGVEADVDITPELGHGLGPSLFGPKELSHVSLGHPHRTYNDAPLKGKM